MDDTLKSVLRWVVAGAVLLLVVFITIPLAMDALSQSVQLGEIGGGAGADPGELTPVTAGSAGAVGDFSVRDGLVRQAEEEFVAIGGAPGDAVVFAFEQFPGHPECIASVAVVLTPTQVEAGTELIVTPARVTNTAELSDGDEVPDPLFVEAPDARLEVLEPVAATIDVTAMYVAWVGGQATEEPEAPFALTLRPPDTVDDRRIRFASSEIEEGAPTMSWEGVEGCGVTETQTEADA